MMFAVASMAMADNYFDDDIYYDASKAKKSQKVGTATKTPQVLRYEPVMETVDYSTYSGSMRDVDEYNRQGMYSSYSDTLGGDSILNIDGYTYTNRIERFYNPEVVSGSGNQELIDSYSVNQPVVNIYVDSFWDPYPSWTWGYSYPWYSWNYTFYTGVWNPYWISYSWYNPWYWDPYCHHYPYYAPHHHHHGPAYYPHHSGVRPTPSSAYRPHRSGNRTGSVSRPGYTRNNRAGSNPSVGLNRGRGNSVGAPSNNSRPRNMSDDRGNYRRTPGMNSSSREGVLKQDNTNSSSNKNNVSRPNNTTNRGSNVSSRSNRSQSNSSYSRPSNSSSSRSSSSYSRPSSSSSRSSGGFSGGGSRGGGGGRGRH